MCWSSTQSHESKDSEICPCSHGDTSEHTLHTTGGLRHYSCCSSRGSLGEKQELLVSSTAVCSTESEGCEDDQMSCLEFMQLPSRYIPVLPLGAGGFGSVIMARDTLDGGLVAIKRIELPFRTPHRATCCYREVYHLRRFKHPYIISIRDAFLCEDDLCLVTEYISNDLRNLLKMNGRMSCDQAKVIIHQCLQAVCYMHSKGVVHRDLKPENILICDSGNIKICDLGLARRMEAEMTGYLATRFYRAPEFMLTWRNYGTAVDVWSLGCILIELATGAILFPAADHITHIRMICELLGPPSESFVARICSQTTSRFIKMLEVQNTVDFKLTFGPFLGAEGADLAQKMLTFDPDERISPEEALRHDFFKGMVPQQDCRLAQQAPSSPTQPVKEDESMDEIRRKIHKELDYFRIFH